MKAIVYEKYGNPDVLELQEIKKPAPNDNQILVKVHASSVNKGDIITIKGELLIARLFSGLFKPKNPIPGWDLAGTVESVGRNIKNFKPGDEVFGGVSDKGPGSFAQYVCVTEDIIAIKPPQITFEQAAAIPVAASTALQGLRYKKQIKAGDKVLINGASGGVGNFAAQIAKAFGAEITAVCSSADFDTLASLGIDHVIDYKSENFTKNGKKYDYILGANGYHHISDYKRSLNPNGIYSCTGGSGKQLFQSMVLGPFYSIGSKKKLGNMGVADVNKADLEIMAKLAASGKVVPVIDRIFNLSEIADAIRYVEKEHICGKVVIRVEH